MLVAHSMSLTVGWFLLLFKATVLFFNVHVKTKPVEFISFCLNHNCQVFGISFDFLSVFFAIHLFAASQRNLLAPATMEITFHQFGNYSILINKIFPMELGLEWCSFCFSCRLYVGWLVRDFYSQLTDNLGAWWEHKQPPNPHLRGQCCTDGFVLIH